MTLGTLLPPIAIATVLNAFLFAGAWRATQTEKRTGQAPWYLTLGLAVYAAALGGFAYLSRGRTLSAGFDLFAAAMAGEAFGIVIVWALLNGFMFSRGYPKRQRFLAIGMALALLAGMTAAAFH